MNKDMVNKKFTEILKEGFRKEMPKIRKEIKVYESRLKEGKLNTSPKVAPQFNR